MNDLLTVVLTLKGREYFTLRWLWHHNRIKFPFKIIIADGQVDPKLSSMIKNKSNFPELDYEYVEWADLSLQDYFLKCWKSVELVNTKYVRFADNDDFLSPEGLKQDVLFLENNPVFVCTQGAVVGFGIHKTDPQFPLVTGRLNSLRDRYNSTYKNKEFNSETPLDRAAEMANDYHPLFYGVYRKEALRIVTQEIVVLAPENLLVHEHFWSLRSVVLGKASTRSSHISYYRQLETGYQFNEQNDWIHKVLRKNFTDDLKRMIGMLSASIQPSFTSVDNTDISEKLWSAYESHTRKWIIKNYQRPKAWHLRLAKLKGRLVNVSRKPLMRERFFNKLSIAGINRTSIDAYKDELREIEKSLESSDLRQLLLEFSPNIESSKNKKELHPRRNLA
ncbi:MAG: TIGR00180 family glycosyltransferase [Bdellovibrionota bacterium]